MSWPDIFLLCMAVGVLWSFAGLFLGGLHLGHFGQGHFGHAHGGSHSGGAHMPGHAHSHGPGHGHAHGHAQAHGHAKAGSLDGQGGAFQHHLLSMANPSGVAAFLAWFGGVGYLLTRHSGWAFWLNLLLATSVGLAGAWVLGSFLHFLQKREAVMDLGDDFVGVLGQVAAPIRPDGVGELIYQRDGARRALPARSEDGVVIERGQEVIVTRYERGIAYVRTWEEMTRDLRSGL
jgi:hypothetical protein